MQRLLCFFALILFASQCLAHTRWILPSHTDLSGSDPHDVAFDLSISLELYHADFSLYYEDEWSTAIHADITYPDGGHGNSDALIHMPKRSIFSSTLDRDGTYRFELLPRDLHFTDYQLAGDERMYRAWEEVPEEAVSATEVTYRSRLTTYVSRNGITDVVPTKKGLELSGDHPNDLFAKETTQLQLLLDGEPVEAGVHVRLIPGGTRYRNDRNEIDLETDSNGEFSVTWPTAGMYLVEVEHDVANGENSVIRHATYVTLEVMPF